MDNIFLQKLNDSVIQFKDYLCSERNLAANTVEAYSSDVLQFVSFVKEVSEDLYSNRDDTSFSSVITIDIIDDFIIYLSNRTFENTSILRKISSISLYLKFLKLEKLIEDNPSRFLIRPRTGTRLPLYLTVEEVERFIDSFDIQKPCGIRDRALFELMYSCGLRVSEICDLNIEDVFFDEKLVKVTGKGDKQRFVPMGVRAIQCINDYLNNGRSMLVKSIKQNALFLNFRGDRITRKGIWKNLKANMQLLGIKKEVTVHTLRHSFATHLVQNGADIRYIQSFLGHKSINTTEIYAHLDMRHIKEVYDKVNES
ncbi:MAG: tyrosine recombinase [Spirochaetales bacterium]|mgnify:CR=1 FL=1|nr:tyrosine recombinase [Spirochaetales bacterium]